MLRQPTDVDPYPVDCVEPPHSFRCENVDHAGCESAVGHDRQPLGVGFGVELLLLHDDLGIATEIGEVAAGGHSEGGHRSIEVVRECAHHGSMARHEVANGGMICHVERDRAELRVIARGEKPGHPFGLDVRQGDLGDFRILEQIKCAGGAL